MARCVPLCDPCAWPPFYSEDATVAQRGSKLSVHQSHPGLLGLPRVSVEWVWAASWDFVSLASPQVLPLVVREPHWENQGVLGKQMGLDLLGSESTFVSVKDPALLTTWAVLGTHRARGGALVSWAAVTMSTHLVAENHGISSCNSSGGQRSEVKVPARSSSLCRLWGREVPCLSRPLEAASIF